MPALALITCKAPSIFPRSFWNALGSGVSCSHDFLLFFFRFLTSFWHVLQCYCQHPSQSHSHWLLPVWKLGGILKWLFPVVSLALCLCWHSLSSSSSGTQQPPAVSPSCLSKPLTEEEKVFPLKDQLSHQAAKASPTCTLKWCFCLTPFVFFWWSPYGPSFHTVW